MKILGVIPSRYSSTRFPGKPLVDLAGKSMIQRVYEQANKCAYFDRVLVATDHEKIRETVLSFNGNVVMTSDQHKNGTERCLEALESCNEDYDYVINIQGDEPFIDPRQIDALCQILDQKVELGTLVKRVSDPEVLTNPNVMKVVFDKSMKALYFSRSCIPYVRGASPESWLSRHDFYKHIGIYAYRVDILKQIVSLPLASLEEAESLEQLRWLENGYQIKLAKTDIETFGIDTPDDLMKALAHLNQEVK